MTCNQSSNGKDQRNSGDGVTASSPAKSTEEYKVGPRRPPKEYQFKPGQSGNPKGRKPKNPSNDLEQPSALEQALDQKIKLKQGGKRRVITRRTALREQTINQAITGDHRARRDLMYAEKHGIDLFTGQHKAIQERIAAAARSSSDLALSEEVVDRLNPGTLDEIIRVMKELEAEKNKEID